mmetsp:Transcript_25908/g.69996  ORF Transcript_25908/g.69996 Transcript_25908/m.69996 type:complete len:232 (+) Transcript_25908:2311-3006(+)
MRPLVRTRLCAPSSSARRALVCTLPSWLWAGLGQLALTLGRAASGHRRIVSAAVPGAPSWVHWWRQARKGLCPRCASSPREELCSRPKQWRRSPASGAARAGPETPAAVTGEVRTHWRSSTSPSTRCAPPRWWPGRRRCSGPRLLAADPEGKALPLSGCCCRGTSRPRPSLPWRAVWRRCHMALPPFTSRIAPPRGRSRLRASCQDSHCRAVWIRSALRSALHRTRACSQT